MDKRLRDVEVIPTLPAAVQRVMVFREDLRTLRHHGLSGQRLADLLGVNRREVFRWCRGTHYPRDPVTLVSVMLWAEDLRQKDVSGAGASHEETGGH